MTNEELRQMAQSALSNWDFDEETDPDGAIKKGIDWLASDGDFDDVESINVNVKSIDDWDGLHEWALHLGAS